MKQVKNIGRLFLLFGIIVCFNRCEKDKLVGSNNGNIHVRQYKTGVAIAGAKIIVTKGNLSSGVGTIPVDTLYTDADGNATYTGEIDNSYFYYAEAYRDNYFDTHNNQASLTSGTANIVMYANSYVKLHVKNVNPFDQYDLIQLQSYCHPNLFFQGFSIDTTFLYCDYDYVWMGEFHYSYSALITKNSQISTIPYSFVPIPFDTMTININY